MCWKASFRSRSKNYSENHMSTPHIHFHYRTSLETLLNAHCAKLRGYCDWHVEISATLFLQGIKWPYLTVPSWHIKGLGFAQQLVKPVISKIIPDGTKAEELVLENYIPSFGMILMPIIYVKSDLFQEIILMWIVLWFSVFNLENLVVLAYPKRYNLGFHIQYYKLTFKILFMIPIPFFKWLFQLLHKNQRSFQ